MDTIPTKTGSLPESLEKPDSSSNGLKLVLAGNPNSGKTSIFNMLTGARQKVGNYGGVTVDIRKGKVKHKSGTAEIVDLPGTYSLTAFSIEEQVARDYIVNEEVGVVINVLDSTNLERNLYLTMQLIELGAPLLLVFNMSDEADKKGIRINMQQLGNLLGAPALMTVGRTGKGVKEILPTAIKIVKGKCETKPRPSVKYPAEIEKEIVKIENLFLKSQPASKYDYRWLALKLLESDSEIELYCKHLTEGGEIIEEARQSKMRIESFHNGDSDTLIAESRYGFIKGAVRETVRATKTNRIAFSDRIDRLLTNRLLAFPIFLAFMWALFQLTFTIGQYPMDWIESAMGWLGSMVAAYMAEGDLRNLMVDGVIGGVGSVVIFLPNILILFFGVSLMEDTGYMARAAFIMDKLMHFMGLHGKSFIPMVMGFGCNVPAIMATRTLASRSDRILTILLAPLVSCSARLPIYILFAGAFFTKHAGNVIFLIYVIGLGTAFLLGRIFRKTLFSGEEFPFVMELPPYRVPTIRSVIIHMWEKGKHYLKKMGGVVLVFSIILWFMGAFPKDKKTMERFDYQIKNIENSSLITEQAKVVSISGLENERNSLLLQKSYIGRLGKIVEPIIAPLGFDWRAGVSLITGFVAKEVVVSSMGVLFNAGEDEGEESAGLREKLKNAFTPLSAFAFMVFCLLYTPCIVALVTVVRELKDWRFSVFSVAYQLIIAWSAAFVIYQGGKVLGLS